ncbi:MAG: D-alanine--D-alanine ligase [Desulfatirhabdiaceae bacterium]
MKKLTLALLSGGVSSEREVSLKSGDQVYDALDKDKYHIVRYDPKTDLQRLVIDAPSIDVALIILHGPYGEDGTIQGMLDLLDIPYQGSGVLGSAIAMNKLASKQLYEKSGIPRTSYLVVHRDDTVQPDDLVQRIGLPMVIKPVQGGSSIGMAIVRTVDKIFPAIQTALNFDDSVLVEAYISGIELTVGVLGNTRLQALPVIEIIPDDRFEFFDYHAKYTAGASQEICPARIDDILTEKAQSYAKMAHTALFCEGYSRTDMILSGKDIHVLETNTIPGMTATSLLPRAAKTAGIPFTRLMDILIEQGLERRNRKISSALASSEG